MKLGWTKPVKASRLLIHSIQTDIQSGVGRVIGCILTCRTFGDQHQSPANTAVAEHTLLVLICSCRPCLLFNLGLCFPAVLGQASASKHTSLFHPDERSLVSMHTYIHRYLHTNTQTNKQTNQPTKKPTNIHTYLPTYLPTYLHTYIHTHTYTHTYIHACMHARIHPAIHSSILTYILIHMYTWHTPGMGT